MNQDVQPASETGISGHRTKPKNIAQRLEGFVGIAMVVAAVVLLGFLAVGLMNTGNGTPSWIHH